MSNQRGTSKSDRRETLRETARKGRDEQRKRQRRNRLFAQGGIGFGILAVAAIVVAVIVSANSSHQTSTSAGPKNMATDGIVFNGDSGRLEPLLTPRIAAGETPQAIATANSNGTPHVVMYIDWSCPSCKQFEKTYAAPLAALVNEGKASIEIHPVAILDRNYGSSRYSSRAANAAACVANYDPKGFLAVQGEFYANQPAEGSNGLTNSQIKNLVTRAGVTDANVAKCIDGEDFRTWVTNTTSSTTAQKSLRSASTGSFGTPTVLIDGKLWNGSTNLLTTIASR